jgi:hypothetical protein
MPVPTTNHVNRARMRCDDGRCRGRDAGALHDEPDADEQRVVPGPERNARVHPVDVRRGVVVVHDDVDTLPAQRRSGSAP